MPDTLAQAATDAVHHVPGATGGSAPSTPVRPSKRLAYLDWLRGFAVLVMIQSHVFESFMKRDLRSGGAYNLSQFIGGLAAPLFLFIAGIMVGFRIENRDDKGLGPGARYVDVLKRSGYVLLIAELMLLQQWVFQWNLRAWGHLLRADILNCMALAIAASAVVALAPRHKRPGIAIALGAAIAVLAPVAGAWDWHAVPPWVRAYLVPMPGRFAFFPEAAYVPLGCAVGFAIRRAASGDTEGLMRWLAILGFALLYGGEFASNQPYSLYAHSEFWLNSPALIVIRTGIMLVAVAGAFAFSEFGLGLGIVRQLGTTSLLVYWVHVELVYGRWLNIWKKHMTAYEAALAMVAVTFLMYGLSLAKTRFTERRRIKRQKARDFLRGRYEPVIE